MIASLTGSVLSNSNGAIVLDVQGVGYLVNTTNAVCANLSQGQLATVYTSLVVREDAFTLYGFLNKAELDVFDLLRSVNGVGPKSALAILSQLSVDQIGQAVADESDSTFKAVSGIGAKTAKLITLTLAGKIRSSSARFASTHTETTVNALVGLGWSERSARDTVQEVSTPEMSDKQLLKAALQVLAKARKR